MPAKIMFEIYRDALSQGCYRVVYFSELEEHNKETEISRAMAGEHFYDGFIRYELRQQAKHRIAAIVDLLNNRGVLTSNDIDRELKPFMTP